MENDTIRSSGDTTLVDVWLNGRMRRICVARGAIEAELGLQAGKAAALTDEERCAFVRAHMSAILTAARLRLREEPGAEIVTIDAGQIAPSANRRKGERRKSERRKADDPRGIPPEGDRRKSVRRKAERRTRPAATPK